MIPVIFVTLTLTVSFFCPPNTPVRRGFSFVVGTVKTVATCIYELRNVGGIHIAQNSAEWLSRILSARALVDCCAYVCMHNIAGDSVRQQSLRRSMVAILSVFLFPWAENK